MNQLDPELIKNLKPGDVAEDGTVSADAIKEAFAEIPPAPSPLDRDFEAECRARDARSRAVQVSADRPTLEEPSRYRCGS